MIDLRVRQSEPAGVFAGEDCMMICRERGEKLIGIGEHRRILSTG